MKELAFIGDIHGCLKELKEVVTKARDRARQLVFLGDYINRGPDSRGVIDYLISLNAENEAVCTFILGNHDQAFLDALTTGRLDRFLRIGGAATISSYIDRPKDDLLSQLRQAIPTSHIDFLKALIPSAVIDDVFVTHDRATPYEKVGGRPKFSIYGHSPQHDSRPTINDTEALIDTGCGTTSGGRLTCLFWPSLDWVQSSPDAVQNPG